MLTTSKHSLSLISLAVLSSLSIHTQAAEAEKNNKKSDAEVIEVTGYRASVLKSINDKKNQRTIVDSIFAEDIGKNTDQNIADALSRVTGVSIQTEDGEGTTISVRGTESSFNNISLNGVQLTSSDGSSAVDLSAFSSDILSSIQVYKTSSADHDEGALGANVVLKTPSPLNFKNDRRSVELQYRYNEFSDKDNRKLSLSMSHKFSDNFAVMVTASDETQDIRRDQLDLRPEEITAEAGRYSTSDGSENTTDVTGISYNTVKYQMNNNRRDRKSLNTVFQYVPGQDTDIKINISAFEQTVTNNNQEIEMAPLHANSYFSGGDNYYDPTPADHLNSDRVLDPQEDWWTYNPNNLQFEKFLNRQAFGRLNEANKNTENSNMVGTLTVNHYISDTLKAEFTAGYSKTELEMLPGSGGVLSISNRLLNNNDKWMIPSDQIIPNGYDCTDGDCQMVVTPPEDTVGSQPPGVAGNYTDAYGPFTPSDPYANTMQNINVTNVYTQDVNKSVYLDFDWDVDFANIHKIEFGGKWSERRKTYESQWFLVNAVDTTHYDTSQVDEDGNYKELTLRDGWNEVSLIPVSDVAKEYPFAPDGFMEGLVGNNPQYNSDFLNGWYLIDTQRAAEQLYTEEVEFENLLWEPANSNEATVEQETRALYGKLNFEFMDGRLIGDVGLRYVETDVDVLDDQTTLTYHGSPNIWTWHELNNAGLFNPNSPSVCSNFSATPGENDTRQIVRIDQGPVGDPFAWEDAFNGVKQTVNRYDSNGNPIILPDKKFVENGVVYTDSLNFVEDENGELVSVTYKAGDSVPAQYSIDPNSPLKCYDPIFAGSSNGWSSDSAPSTRPDQYSDLSTTAESNRRIRNYDATLTHDYANWLPSLNLNYIFTDELIGRFAISKTMARPKFGDVRAGFRFNESQHSDQNNINNASDPELMPLESTNLDLSIEWYFDKYSQVSLAYYTKDIKNYVDDIVTEVYVADIRRDMDIERLPLAEFLINQPDEINLAQDEILRPGTSLNDYDSGKYAGDNRMCHPDRITNLTWDNLAEWQNRCATVNLNYKTNGVEATVEGIEFSYRQTYDFLPGAWSGLGSNINYTYAESESEPGKIELLGDAELRSTPQANTPKHTLNTSLYWQKFGHSIRLTHRYNSIRYIGRAFNNYRQWEDDKESLDLAINYKVNKNLTFRFDALNLTDATVRRFLTSESAIVTHMNEAGDMVTEAYYAGNPMEDSSVDTSLTRFEYRTGRHYRATLRFNF
ncbi:TonB-dependent receptor domain-containing protein [Gayadomonas joobiniege]|uniref:TonB-dependent receptor domain-containing protein n=1 Tax=Gayadomonas joobiniege TaxID=1234606 RepID=UPI000377B302|nr:TonB-dependent receptor [Gayadomonas joobiniege]